MKRSILLVLCILAHTQLFAQSANDIVKRSEDLLKGKSSYGTFHMMIETPDFTRSMEMETWWVGNDKALIVVTAPRREAGNKTLKVNDELWMYLRNTETTIKIPPSMMLQSWNGSDFTNDDLVRESSLIDDYTMKIAAEEIVDGMNAWKIELIPKPDAPVVWGRILSWIRTEGYLPVRAEYYDESNARVRTMIYSEYKKMGGRMIPAKWMMVNDQKPGHRTTFEFKSVTFDAPISNRIFSFQELEKGKTR
ncbi:MAG: outer membrane lipoprotein-sorting protein [Bacteroidetes bacterium]|nr:outer membrane lipoprotein-sorting protein [Bacteroidota bacterium]